MRLFLQPPLHCSLHLFDKRGPLEVNVFIQQLCNLTFSYGLLQPKPKMSKWPCESVQAKCCPSAENLQSKIAPWPWPSIWKQTFKYYDNNCDIKRRGIVCHRDDSYWFGNQPCWRSCGFWLLWSDPTCKCCHRGQQTAWYGGQMGEPPLQTPRHHDPLTAARNMSRMIPVSIALLFKK